MKLHPDDVKRGCRTIVSAHNIEGWDRGEDGKGYWAEYIHSRENDAGGLDFWSKGKKHFPTTKERDDFITEREKK